MTDSTGRRSAKVPERDRLTSPAGERSLAAGRSALGKRDWDGVVAHLTEADTAGLLSGADLDALAEGLYVAGRSDEAIAARKRAHAEFRARGDRAAAAAMALKMCGTFMRRGEIGVFGGWVATATRLLEDEPESVAHGLLAWVQANGAMFAEQDADAGLVLGERAAEIGRRQDDFDVEALGLIAQAEAHQMAGRVPVAVALIDEVMASAIAGALSPWVSAHVVCRTMIVCQAIGDLGRASQWSTAALESFGAGGVIPVLGDCRVHRAGLLRCEGRWKQAEEEAVRGCEEIPDDLMHLAMARCDIGEIRLREGDLRAAEAEFEQAHALGGAPHPGLALVQLARGEPKPAAALLEQALEEQTSPAGRAGLLAARLEVALAAKDLASAADVAAELTAIADLLRTPALQATALTADGALALARGDASAAIGSLRRAHRLWGQAGIPYEAARARLRLGDAHLARDDSDCAALELRTARATFKRLRALPDVLDAERALRQITLRAQQQQGVAHLQRTFMFTDIVGSTALVEAIGDDAWTDVLRWHDQTLRDLFARHRGEEIDHAGDGFFVAFERSSDALACAIEIQRTLASHRRLHGFSPRLRIGLHADEAARTTTAYAGRGVHLAARVGARANADEILVTRTSVEGHETVGVLDARVVELKGFAEPVELFAVAWR